MHHGESTKRRDHARCATLNMTNPVAGNGGWNGSNDVLLLQGMYHLALIIAVCFVHLYNVVWQIFNVQQQFGIR